MKMHILKLSFTMIILIGSFGPESFTEEQLLDWALERLKEEVGRRTENMKEDKRMKQVEQILNECIADEKRFLRTVGLEIIIDARKDVADAQAAISGRVG
ncbi:hypothetical protein L1987_02277 [Smallanthus sonchifolius]|uniref:Uncharacterized protein n=1 Tax=Smallanthus sonchifolius TaxID=185202 RepID=A0ACB9K7B2_9ASTR|nr:hypothetical protein L1987_02277 [Smallanthus sonchifolius]